MAINYNIILQILLKPNQIKIHMKLLALHPKNMIISKLISKKITNFYFKIIDLGIY